MVVERRLAPGELVRADQAVALKLAQLDPLNVEVIVPAFLAPGDNEAEQVSWREMARMQVAF